MGNFKSNQSTGFIRRKKLKECREKKPDQIQNTQGEKERDCCNKKLLFIKDFPFRFVPGFLQLADLKTLGIIYIYDNKP